MDKCEYEFDVQEDPFVPGLLCSLHIFRIVRAEEGKIVVPETTRKSVGRIYASWMEAFALIHAINPEVFTGQEQDAWKGGAIDVVRQACRRIAK